MCFEFSIISSLSSSAIDFFGILAMVKNENRRLQNVYSSFTSFIHTHHSTYSCIHAIYYTVRYTCTRLLLDVHENGSPRCRSYMAHDGGLHIFGFIRLCVSIRTKTDCEIRIHANKSRVDASASSKSYSSVHDNNNSNNNSNVTSTYNVVVN